SSLADLRRRQGRPEEAEEPARRALAGMEKRIEGPQQPQLARYLNVLAEVLRLRGKTDEAEQVCFRCRSIIENAFGPEHISLDSCLATLARIRAGRGSLGEAEELYRRCLAILDDAVLPGQRERVARMEEYAALLRKMGRDADAAEWEAKAKAVPVWAVVKGD